MISGIEETKLRRAKGDRPPNHPTKSFSYEHYFSDQKFKILLRIKYPYLGVSI